MLYFVRGENKGVVYCPNPRVAGVNTIRTILELGGQKLDVIPDGKLLIVETVRHHLDVLVSHWYSNDAKTPFNDFVKEILDGKNEVFGPQTLYGRHPTNYILRYETLDYEWDNLCVNAGLRPCKITRTLSARPKNIKWQNLFSYHMRVAVCNRYKDEMERLGYGVH